MSEFGWPLSMVLQFAPGDAPLAWYGAGFLLVLLIAAAGIGFWMVRTESDRQPPIGHEKLINAFDDPMVILDPDDNVLIGNLPFRALFGSDIDGEAIEDVLDAYPAVREAITEREETVVTVSNGGEPHHYKINAYPAGQEPRPPRKWIILLQDVTDQHERQTKLEKENEHLEQFASLISHDLRNPLDVAIGRTNVVKEMLDDPELESHLDSVQDSHERMRQIITDVLALASEGHSIGDLQQVPLETAAMDAWSHVDTGDAGLAVNTQMVIQADREQLTRVFENLFRNAIQHGGEDIAVEVASLDDGFFVADNGSGIPPAKRESVLEAGHTDGSDGTGLGLAIVTSIAKGHGWEITVTESESGGAQFEFVGVEQIADQSASHTTE